MKASELRGRDPKDLKKKVVEMKEELFRLKMGVRMGTVKQTSQLQQKKKELARTLTVLKEKEAR